MSQINYVTPETFDIARLRMPTEVIAGEFQTNGWVQYEYTNGEVDQLQVLTDWCYLNWGLHEYKGKWTADISTWKKEENESLNKLYLLCMLLDEQTLQTYYTNWAKWFGTEKSFDVVKDRFFPIIKDENPGKYSPTIKVGVQTTKNGELGINVFDYEFKPVSVEKGLPLLANKGSRCRVLLNASCTWYGASTGFGLKLRAKQFYLPKPYANAALRQPIMFAQPGEVAESVPIVAAQQFAV